MEAERRMEKRTGGERWWLQQSDPQNPEQISNVRENNTDTIKYQKLV